MDPEPFSLFGRPLADLLSTDQKVATGLLRSFIDTLNSSTNGWRNEQIEEATVKAALSWRDGDGMMTSGDTWKAKSTSNNYVKPIILT